MIRNDLRDKFIKGVFAKVIEETNNTAYISTDKKRVIRTYNMKYMNRDIVHNIYNKEDISLANFLFRVDVYVLDNDAEECGYYSKWLSLVELWNENWTEISHDEYINFRNKVEAKLNEYKSNVRLTYQIAQ